MNVIEIAAQFSPQILRPTDYMKIRSIISNIWPRKINPCLDLRHTVQITKLFKLLCRRTCMAPSMSPVALRSQVFLCLRGHCYRIMECKPGGGREVLCVQLVYRVLTRFCRQCCFPQRSFPRCVLRCKVLWAVRTTL